MRNSIYAVLALCSLLFASAAHADPTYTLTLTAATGNAGNGSGSFEINALPSTGINSVSTYTSTAKTGDILELLSFSIGGDTFDLGNAASDYGLVQFTSGALSDITYQGSENTATVILSISASGLSYNFYDSGKGESGTGMITDTLDTAATPEPSSIVLLGTGLLGGLGVLRRRIS